jgi:hypothetical protein
VQELFSPGAEPLFGLAMSGLYAAGLLEVNNRFAVFFIRRSQFVRKRRNRAFFAAR